MSEWQHALLERLDAALPVDRVEVYGSLHDDLCVDGWSDLDIRLRMSDPAGAETLFGARPWAWQESRSDASQILRLVFDDGRRVDAVVSGHPIALPDPAVDNDVRFDSALAATRLGRGNTVVGVHLWAGLVRDALKLAMQLADREAGSAHHPSPTRQDVAIRAELTRLTSVLPTPTLVIAVCDLYAQFKSALDPDYTADWSGLRAVIDRGNRLGVAS